MVFMYYPRKIESEILQSIANNPVTAILGPRQCGKSTLAKHIAEKTGKEFLYLDLEKPSDLQKLDDPEWFLNTQKNKLICLDEIQRKPELFPLLRVLVDEWGNRGNFLILGSASRNLLRQSSESLAGRISYKRLTPFLIDELKEVIQVEDILTKGGFPRSLLATNDKLSFAWREDFITTFLERDLLLWSGFSPVTMRKLWQMLAHLNGQIINYSNLSSSLGVSHTVVRNYIELLASTYMISLLPSFGANIGKRLVKSPKLYFCDNGICNTLLQLTDFLQLVGHPSFGSAWESLVLSNLMASFPLYNFHYYRTSHGAEIDILIENGKNIVAVECKASLSPQLNRGTYTAIDDLKPIVTLVVAPVKERWPMKNGIEVVNINEAISRISESLSW
jgi:uncharacterized protein